MTWTPIEGSFLGGTSCCICETYVVSIEAEADRALCIECGRDRNAVDWTWFEPLGAWHPTVGYAAPGAGERTESRFHRDPVERPPDVTSRDPWPSGVQASAPVVKLVNLAKEHGWDAWMGYSRCGAEELISVRVKRSGIAAHAIYRTASGKSWAWQSFKIIPEGTWPRPCFLLAEFQEFLTRGWRDIEALLSTLADWAEIKANGEALQKRRDAWRKEVRRRYTPGVLVLDAATVEQGEALGYDWADVIKIIMTAKPGKKEGSR